MVIRPYGPTWLLEGSAQLFQWRVQAERAGQSLPAFRAFTIGRLGADIQVQLETLATNSGFQSVRNAYTLGALASEWLANLRGTRAFVDYYRLLGQGQQWSDAFKQAFGITIPDFYATFASYQAHGFQ
jgi:hypothetical protein